MSQSETADLELAQAIAALRGQLEAAMTGGQGHEVRFALNTVVLEAQVQISNEKGVEGGVKFWVVTLGGKAASTASATHTVTLTMTPTGPDGRPLGLISDLENAAPAPTSAVASRPSLDDRE
jgi:hypothetical protein